MFRWNWSQRPLKPELGVQLRPCLRAEGFQRLSYFGAIHPQGDPNLGDRVILGDPCDPVGKAQRFAKSAAICVTICCSRPSCSHNPTNPTTYYIISQVSSSLPSFHLRLMQRRHGRIALETTSEWNLENPLPSLKVLDTLVQKHSATECQCCSTATPVISKIVHHSSLETASRNLQRCLILRTNDSKQSPTPCTARKRRIVLSSLSRTK